jgi:hypothetical protein
VRTTLSVRSCLVSSQVQAKGSARMMAISLYREE